MGEPPSVTCLAWWLTQVVDTWRIHIRQDGSAEFTTDIPFAEEHTKGSLAQSY